MDIDTRIDTVVGLITTLNARVGALVDRVAALEERLNNPYGIKREMRDEKPTAQNCPKCGAVAWHDTLNAKYRCMNSPCSFGAENSSGFPLSDWQRIRFAEEGKP